MEVEEENAGLGSGVMCWGGAVRGVEDVRRAVGHVS